MKKALVIILTLALSIGLASFAIAGDDTSKMTQPDKAKQFKERPQLQITEQQKAQMKLYRTQMLELKKEIIQQNVTNNTITQNQADKMLKRIDVQLEAVKSGDFSPKGGFGFKAGRGGFRGSRQHCPTIQTD